MAWLAGTDASDWGTGQLVWIDGQREEVSLRFTRAEQRRSINWRELLGISRVVELWGPRLAGATVLIETDNTAAHGASEKGASSSEDMQELLRRMFEAAERHDIRLRFVHTPGALLDRPDQTSRGGPVEEPRVRLRGAVVKLLEGRFGAFTEVLGAERQLMRKRAAEGAAPNLFVHTPRTPQWGLHCGGWENACASLMVDGRAEWWSCRTMRMQDGGRCCGTSTWWGGGLPGGRGTWR